MRKLIGPFGLAWFMWRTVRREDVVLFYNHELEYFLALVLLRLRRIAVFHDIEDVPPRSDRSPRGRVARIGFALMMALSSPRKVVVSEQIGRDLHLAAFEAVQGVVIAQPWLDAVREEKWRDLRAGGPLRVHFGGSLTPETGLDVFAGAVAWLAENTGRLKTRIELQVTGIGNLDRLESVASGLDGQSGFGLEVHRNLGRAEFLSIIESCHISLSLKLPDAVFSHTTFPSKVIEITSRGLALITTRISDVPVIFGADSVYFLNDVTAEELGSMISRLASMPEDVHVRARAGAEVARARFSAPQVGERLARFLEAGP